MAAAMDTTTIMLQTLERIDDQRRADQEKFEKHWVKLEGKGRDDEKMQEYRQ